MSPSDRDFADLHQEFQRDLVRGHSLHTVVALRFLDAGLWVRLPPLQVAPEFGDRHDYLDTTDVQTIHRSKVVHVEVKSTRFEFTEGGADFRFARPFVMTEAAWEAKDPRPVAVVLVSQPTKATAVIPASTAPSWTVRRTMDQRRGYEDNFLTVSRDQLRPLSALIEWLKA